MNPQPPKRALQFLRWFCREDYLEEFEGDLIELFEQRHVESPRKARRKFFWGVLRCFRPGFTKAFYKVNHSNTMIMFNSYFKTALRHLLKNKAYSFINIGGLVMGMTVAMLIGLWIHNELTFNTYHQNYDSIARVMKKETHNGTRNAGTSQPFALAEVLRNSYGDYFKHVVMEVSWTGEHTIGNTENKFSQSGRYMEPSVLEMLSLNMIYGDRNGLSDPNSIVLSESLAKKLFGDTDPVGQPVTMDGEWPLKVTGVYADLPKNTEFHGTTYIASFDLFYSAYQWAQPNSWRGGNVSIYVQASAGIKPTSISEIIKDAMLPHVDEERAAADPELFLQPMSQWHLFTNFDNPGTMSAQLKFVWFYGLIGVFVLLLACINFVNISTARSEKRAKEVGIRKAIGSHRTQLISQFLGESLLFAGFAFVLSIGAVQLALPWFNGVAGKSIHILWADPSFWLVTILFTIFIGILAGSYPAFYLSSFKSVKALKGFVRNGRHTATPRKLMVIFQFIISITLVIGTFIVYQQIEFAKNRPVGYSRDGLIMLGITTEDYNGKYDLLRAELLNTGVVAEMAGAGVPVTENQHTNTGFAWKGKAPAFDPIFKDFYISHEFGDVVEWDLIQGRDFSRDFPSDKNGVIINEAALKLMQLENPIGETLTWERRNRAYTILGVVRDMVRYSPYEPIPPSVFLLTDQLPWIHIRINPESSLSESLPKIKAVLNQVVPTAPFDYRFVEEEYAAKFQEEERVGKLAGFFAVLAIFISCLGVFGLASFVAEQRTKEMGVRKVLGASVFNLWKLLSRSFVLLIFVAVLISISITYYFMEQWLQQYAYHTTLSWWIFALSALGVLIITMVTVSYQSIKAAMVNPVKSLRTE